MFIKVLFEACLVLSFVTAQSASNDYDHEVASLAKKVAVNSKYIQLTSDLMAYAKVAVETNRSAIQANLADKSLGTVDLIWPGNGFNTPAYGGQYEVLSLLERGGVLGIGKIMGASGGAAGTILSLADDDLSSAALLKYHYVYAESKESSDPQVIAETPLWTAIYQAAIQTDEAFNRVKARGRVACACGLSWSNDVFYNFSSREQAAKAYYASGDLSAHGIFLGTWIPDFSKVGTCSDGGSVTYFPDSSGALIYFHAFYGYVTQHPEAAGIEYLFRKGVDDTIKLLTSKELLVEKSKDGNGGMQMVPPGPSGRVGKEEYSALQKKWGLSNGKAYFHDIAAESGTGFLPVVHV